MTCRATGGTDRCEFACALIMGGCAARMTSVEADLAKYERYERLNVKVQPSRVYGWWATCQGYGQWDFIPSIAVWRPTEAGAREAAERKGRKRRDRS